MSNQRRVWQEENKALEERKRIEQMVKERQEERQIQELQEMQEAAGGKKRLNRVDWMYSGPAAGQAGTTEEMEGYLLGKRRVDGLIKGTEHRNLEKAASEDSFMALQKANTARDTASKIREDPMLAIKKQEQAAYETLMNDPVKRRLLLKAAGGNDVASGGKDRKHRRRHHRERDDHDYHRNHRRQRRDHGERPERSGRPQYRRHSDSSSYSKSPSPYRRRSPSPYYRRSRSPSPYRRRRSDSSLHGRSHSSSPEQRPSSPRRRIHHHHTLKTSKSWHNSYRKSPPPPRRGSDDRAAKLAAMQENAVELDQDRGRRFAEIAKQEELDRVADEVARVRSAKYGGRGDFVHGLNRKAGDLDIGERMRRGRQNLGREGRDDD
ncbi:MAG: hypothetical protein Q9220_005158 [cf. Caloplaca sp. 1 TL-2023]